MMAFAFDENPYGIHERQLQQMHRQINGAATADLGARVVPHGPCRENLELAARRACVPSASGRLLDGLEARIRLAVSREQRQRVLAGHLAKRRQRRAIKGSTHRRSLRGSRNPPRTPPGYSPLKRLGATRKTGV